MTLLTDVVTGMNEHAATAARRVVHRVAWSGFQHPHQRIHHRRWCEEFPSLRARIVGELLDQILICTPKDVRRDVLVRQVVLVEVLHQCMHDLVGDERTTTAVRGRLVPVDGEDSPQLLVGAGHGAHRTGQHGTDVHRCRLDVPPPRSVRDAESMFAPGTENRSLLLGELTSLLSLQLSDRIVRLMLPLIAKTLVEHQRKDVVLVILPSGLTAQNVGGTPQVCFELLLRELHACSCNRK